MTAPDNCWYREKYYFSDWVYLDKTLFDFISIHFRSPLLPFFSPTSVKESFSLVELVGVSKVEDMTPRRSKHAQQHIEPASKTPHSAETIFHINTLHVSALKNYHWLFINF